MANSNFNPYQSALDSKMKMYGGQMGLPQNQFGSSNQGLPNYNVTNPYGNISDKFGEGQGYDFKNNMTGLTDFSGAAKSADNIGSFMGGGASSFGEVSGSPTSFGNVAGSAMAIGSTAGGMASQAKDQINIGKDYDRDVSGSYEGAGGQPIYTAHDEILNLKGLDETDIDKLGGKFAAKGALAGLTVPGGPIAKGIGALVGGITGGFGGRKATQKAEEEKALAIKETLENIKNAQLAFNDENLSFSENQNMIDMNDFRRREREERMYNIPNLYA